MNSLLQQGEAFIKEGRIPEGLQVFDKALLEDPQNVRALAGSGVGHSLNGNPKSAVELFNRAHAVKPDEIQVLLNLGHAYMALWQGQDALDAFEKAFAIDSKNGDTCYWIAFLSEKKGDRDKAIEFYRLVLEYDPSKRDAYLRLADILFVEGHQRDSLIVLQAAEARFPGEGDITFARGKLISKSAPGWHLPMLHDQERNDAYEAAINAVVKEGDIVLDIGTGSGLLAMMAARAGAEHVYACEKNAILASLAREIVQKNGFADKITIIEKNSANIIIGEDMPVRADVMVTEIFDSAVIGEGALPSILHAWQHLLDSEARVVPQSATLYGSLAQCPPLQAMNGVELVNGFDLTPVNVFAQPFAHRDTQIHFASSDDCKILSDAFTINNFDFSVPPAQHFKSECSVFITEAGEADSVLMWFDLNLAPGVIFTTAHYVDQHHWRPVSQTLHDKTVCKIGDKMVLNTNFEGFFDFKVKA